MIVLRSTYDTLKKRYGVLDALMNESLVKWKQTLEEMKKQQILIEEQETFITQLMEKNHTLVKNNFQLGQQISLLVEKKHGRE